MKLKIVPPATPSSGQAAIERLKKSPRPDGMIQCARCGSRTILNTVTGAFVKDGRKQGGTKTHTDVCYHCHVQGIWSPMLPSPPKLVKEPKPRRTKPKAVK